MYKYYYTPHENSLGDAHNNSSGMRPHDEQVLTVEEDENYFSVHQKYIKITPSRNHSYRPMANSATAPMSFMGHSSFSALSTSLPTVYYSSPSPMPSSCPSNLSLQHLYDDILSFTSDSHYDLDFTHTDASVTDDPMNDPYFMAFLSSLPSSNDETTVPPTTTATTTTPTTTPHSTANTTQMMAMSPTSLQQPAAVTQQTMLLLPHLEQKQNQEDQAMHSSEEQQPKSTNSLSRKKKKPMKRKPAHHHSSDVSTSTTNATTKRQDKTTTTTTKSHHHHPSHSSNKLGQCEHPKHVLYRQEKHTFATNRTDSMILKTIPRRGRPPKGAKLMSELLLTTSPMDSSGSGGGDGDSPTLPSSLPNHGTGIIYHNYYHYPIVELTVRPLPKRLEAVVGKSNIKVCLTCLKRSDMDPDYLKSSLYVGPQQQHHHHHQQHHYGSGFNRKKRTKTT
ncbi:hypothetical protein BDF20DRAFT_914257 [Mycotypha africana]|uniref:uncharacterized protein n=1 Tax=Mycotypha africana TaxID=64632 RepID=UPI002301A65F|nr:uncharacterized protein BDF20DRAFT_914257 [Mycotypha africana]KAI8975309.1 hypothetical protein BDF20DRAFT_914257 [Mycotypha africana]